MVSDFSIDFFLGGEKSQFYAQQGAGPWVLPWTRGNGWLAIMLANDARGNLSILPHDLF
ncbi:MAG: hypothetical protein NTAFB09_22800 [Nitrosospira sp.]